MSVVEPKIDRLVEVTQQDRYLLCAVAAKRSRDINNMMRGQRDRALALQSVDEISRRSGRKPLSIALEEIAAGDVSYDSEAFDSALKSQND